MSTTELMEKLKIYKEKFQEAVLYLQTLEANLHQRPGGDREYEKLIQDLRNSRSRPEQVKDVGHRIQKLCPGLLHGFNTFLREEDKISIVSNVSFEDALAFAFDVKKRFREDSNVFLEFRWKQDALRKTEKTVADFCREAELLFSGHQDLINRLSDFLPDSSESDGSPESRKRKRRKPIYYDPDVSVPRERNADAYRHKRQRVQAEPTGKNGCNLDMEKKKKKPVEGEKNKSEASIELCGSELLNLKMCTSSYFLLPRNFQWPSSTNKDEASCSVLNNSSAIACSDRRKDSYSRTRVTSSEEQKEFEWEDKVCQKDIQLEKIRFAIGQCEEYMKEDEDIDFKKHFSAFSLRCMEELYSELRRRPCRNLEEDPRRGLAYLLPSLKGEEEKLSNFLHDLLKRAAMRARGKVKAKSKQASPSKQSSETRS